MLLKNNNNKNLYFFKDRDQIGSIMKNISDLNNKCNYIDSNLNKIEQDIFKLRNLRIKNYGNSLKQSALAINNILNDKV